MTVSLLKPRSSALNDRPNRAGARSMLRACGLRDDDFSVIGVANTWIENARTITCANLLCTLNMDPRTRAHPSRIQHNFHLRRDHHGTEGMRASLISREVITDPQIDRHGGNLLTRLSSSVDATVPFRPASWLRAPEYSGLRRFHRSRKI